MAEKKSSDELKGEANAMKKVADKIAKLLGSDYSVYYSFTNYTVYIHNDITGKDYTLTEYIKYLQRCATGSSGEEDVKKEKSGDIIW